MTGCLMIATLIIMHSAYFCCWNCPHAHSHYKCGFTVGHGHEPRIMTGAPRGLLLLYLPGDLQISIGTFSFVAIWLMPMVTFLLRCRSGYGEGVPANTASLTKAWVGLKAVPGVYTYYNEHCWAQDTCKIKKKNRYKQLWQWKRDTKWQSVSIRLNIHCGRRLVKCIRHDCGGVGGGG